MHSGVEVVCPRVCGLQLLAVVGVLLVGGIEQAVEAGDGFGLLAAHLLPVAVYTLLGADLWRGGGDMKVRT